ncbi:membrane-associated oxidoreductase [Streptomyces sp. NBC_00019]|uniref:membrane-associated oxidoreductase n=1 Tax=Streptomyces sp. NBC_00019 TaxID=2975623 RepID=UPI00324F64DA
MEINDLTPAERQVWEAFATGTAVDLRDTPEGTVRATVLRALMLNGPQSEGEIPGLKVAGARITGVLDVRYGTVETYVRLSRCHFEEMPQLYGCRFRQLNLSGSELPGLAASSVRVEGGALRLTECRFRGPVNLAGSQISGALFMDRAEFRAPDDSEDPALRLNHSSIGEDLVATGIRVRGRLVFNSASVAASVNFNDARLENPRGTAIDAQALSANTVHARNLTALGRVEMRGVHIAGQLNLTRARLSNPRGTALRASSAVIGELWLRDAEPVEGAVNLRRAQLELLHAAPQILPSEVRLDGLTYTTLAPHVTAEQRLSVLDRDADGYVPHAYEQLTAAYLRIGDDYAARQVQLAKQRRLRATRAWYGRLWGYLQDVTVGYGFRPLRACAWLVSLLAVGSLVYALHEPPPLKASEHPDFDPVFFTLDLLLPVISFGQEGAFAPEGGYQALSYALVITGWILATTVVTGVTRAVSRQ